MSDDYRTERVDSPRRLGGYAAAHDGHGRRHLPTHAYEQVPPPHHEQTADMASALGLPASALTPDFLAAVAPLLEEIGRLHWLLDQALHRTDWLERQSDRHSLVPCLTRRAFVRETEAFLAGGEAMGTLALVQVLGMEAVRHTHGLAAAEAAMRHIAAIVVGAVRTSDVVGCLGGADFAVLLPNASEEQARLKLDGICNRMADPPFVWQGQAVTLTPCVGLHALAAGDGAESAIAAADLARRGVA